jgi:hypothetical protein
MNIPTLEGIKESVPQIEVSNESGETYLNAENAINIGKTGIATRLFPLPGNNMTITDSAHTIFSTIAPTNTLFWRGGSVVEVIRNGDKTEFKIITENEFCSRIEKYDHTVVGYVMNPYTKQYALSQKACTREAAARLLAAAEASELPQISAISNCDLLIEENGQSKILSCGYNPELGGVYISQQNGAREVGWEEAVDAIKSTLLDFNFQSEGDRSRAIASILTPALRFGGHISGSIPVDVAEANESQSGKTYRQKVLAAIYGEAPEVATQIKGIGGGDEPFFNALCRGRPFIQFDNCRGKIDSPSVEAFITTNGGFNARGAYKKWGAVDSRKFYIMLTSNGFEATRDFCNRSNIIRIKKQPKGFQYTQYSEGDLLEHIRANQSYYLGCVFAIIKEWIARGKPKTDDTGHDFREWNQICDWVVQTLFGCVPLMDGHEKMKERVSNPNMTWLRKVALATDASSRLGEQLSASEINELCDQEAIELPGRLSSNNAGAANRKVGLIMSKLFKDSTTLKCEEFEITREKKTEVRTDPQKGYTEIKVYAFNKPIPHNPTTP